MLKILGPAVLLTAVVADLCLRALPPEAIWFRAWEGALTLVTAEGPFRPNYVYDNPRSFGDAANLENCIACRHYRRERFTTNAQGFRDFNPANRPATGLLTGDSFGVGSGLIDAAALAPQLDRELGEAQNHIFNASGPLPDWSILKRVIETQRIRNSVLIWEHAEIHPYPSGPLEPAPPALLRLAQRAGGGRDAAWYRAIGSLRRQITEQTAFSPLRIFVQKGFRTLERDGWLPAPATGDAVFHKALQRRPGGASQQAQDILFLDLERQVRQKPYRPDLAYFEQVRQALAASGGNRLLIVLTPSKYSVYAPLLADPPADAAASTLARDVAQFEAAGIAALDLTPVLRAQAAQLLERGQFNYHLDDTHWNEAGVRESARVIAEEIRKRALK